ncbi:MAG: DegT/DnrJ/EryC1/StrS family aminotransferase [Chloroflexi bacterium]|nr:DegT/DnrJ/EryC1/StrS family aminotransferase [Chloroflexota bacterium]
MIIRRKSDSLAVHGGAPVRDVATKPWPAWPHVSEEEWEQAIGPALKDVYLSSVEADPAPNKPGPKAGAFADAFARYCGTRYGIMTPSGTTALSLAIQAALDATGLDDRGEVIVPDYTYVASASSVLLAGYSVVFADIHPETFTLDPYSVEAAITDRTVAILPVHVAGHPADMDAINRIARKHGLKVIEDCAQAHGAEVNGHKVGSLGDAGAYSFQATKNLTAGESGAVITNDQAIFERVQRIRDMGRQPGGKRWEYATLGWNYRTSDYLAAILQVRLKNLDEQSAHRNANAAFLTERLREIEGITPPHTMPWATRHAYHLYAILYHAPAFGGHSRDEFVDALRAEGIPVVAGYSPLSQTQAMTSVATKHPGRIRVVARPNLEAIEGQAVWVTQDMLMGTRQDLDDIVEAIAKVKRSFNVGI